MAAAARRVEESVEEREALPWEGVAPGEVKHSAESREGRIQEQEEEGRNAEPQEEKALEQDSSEHTASTRA